MMRRGTPEADAQRAIVSALRIALPRDAIVHHCANEVTEAGPRGAKRQAILVGMGVIPFEFTGGDSRKSLGLTGDETVSISGLDTIEPLQEVPCTITMADGTVHEVSLKCRIDTAIEIEYIEHGGVLHYVLRSLAAA